MFRFFKKKDDAPPQSHNPQQPIEQEYYNYGTPERPEPKEGKKLNNWRKKFNFFGGNDEKIARNSLAKYSIPKKPLVWNYGTGERKIGYAIAIIPRPHGEYIILYQQKSRDFLDEVFNRLKEIILGSKERYRVLYVPESCVTSSNEIVTVYAHSFRMENEFTEVAIPLEGGDPRKRILYEMALDMVGMYESALSTLTGNLNNVVECALYLNPTLQTYRGKEYKEGKKGEKHSKEFEGSEFSYFGFLNNIKEGFMRDDDD